MKADLNCRIAISHQWTCLAVISLYPAVAISSPPFGMITPPKEKY